MGYIVSIMQSCSHYDPHLIPSSAVIRAVYIMYEAMQFQLPAML